jgi:hypothetical protein
MAQLLPSIPLVLALRQYAWSLMIRLHAHLYYWRKMVPGQGRSLFVFAALSLALWCTRVLVAQASLQISGGGMAIQSAFVRLSPVGGGASGWIR